MENKIKQIIDLFNKHNINVKYENEKDFHVVRMAGRDTYVYIKFMNGCFGIKFMNDWHHPMYLEQEMERIQGLIEISNQANEILNEKK